MSHCPHLAVRDSFVYFPMDRRIRHCQYPLCFLHFATHGYAFQKQFLPRANAASLPRPAKNRRTTPAERATASPTNAA